MSQALRNRTEGKQRIKKENENIFLAFEGNR